MSKTYDVYIANGVFDITCANTPADRYHGPFLHLSNVSTRSLINLKSVADAGEISIAYELNDEEDSEDDA